MKKTIEIGKRCIEENGPLFIIAEVGVTCNYDVNIAKELIDATSKAGADAVKFIFWFPDEIMSDRNIPYSYETVNGMKTENMYDMLNKLRFSEEQWKEVKAYADQKNIVFFATVNSPSGITLAEALNVEAYKLSSWDYNYFPLWQEIARLQKPMLIDTGPVNTTEVSKVINLMKKAGNDQSILIHCYHTDDYGEINMRSIPYMKKAFDTLVGFSAKDRDDDMDIVAVSLGACVLEKRLTMSRELPGHHHILSKEPKEFSDYVRHIRDIRRSLGIENLNPSQTDLEERKKWFRHIVAKKNIAQGTKITAEHLACKRPEKGISPESFELIVGRELKRELKENEAISWEDV